MPQKAIHSLLSVEGLTIEFGSRRVVDELTFSLHAGKTLCIAGESGSGKSLTSLAIMGLLPRNAHIPKGAIIFDNTELTTLSERQRQQMRGRDIGMIFQEPMTSLNPLMTIGQQMGESLRRHAELDRRGRKARVLEMLDAVKMSQPEKRLRQYPNELSGGMRQRVMIAMAMLCQPRILIADEPTTALDVTIQAQILELMRDLQVRYNTGILMITHDMGVVAEMADDVLVMNQGRVEEHAEVNALFHAPQAQYTRTLLNSVPVLGKAPPISQVEEKIPLLRVRDLSVRFPTRREGFSRREIYAVDKVSFDLFPGETLGIVGESGCGKSTTGKALMNMVNFTGSAQLEGKELRDLKGNELQTIRREIQMVFQDPAAALNSRKTIFDLVGEPLYIHEKMPTAERKMRVEQLLKQVGLPGEVMTRYPHQFSGGQRQRICIARALALNPKVIIADESVSALDVSVQAQVLELLESLREQFKLSYLFISHDMAVVERLCHRVAVMFGGRIVEYGPRDQVLHHPRHPYTRRLLSAVPMPEPGHRRDAGERLDVIERPDPIKPHGWQSPAVQFVDYGNGHFAVL